MCIGIPLQVETVEPGPAWAVGRGERRRVETALVGAVQPGDWLLVFLDSARERIGAQRAAEIDAALDLLADALGGATTFSSPGFDLPSAMSVAELAALSGTPDISLGKDPR